MRLIDADALKPLLREYCVDDDEVVMKWYDIMGVDEVIDRAPTIDAVPVVRCKDCKHRIKWNDSFGCAFWGYYGDEFADGEMFCRKGERKDDD